MLDALVARWGQGVRYAVIDGVPGATAGAYRGVVINASIARVAEVLASSVNE